MFENIDLSRGEALLLTLFPTLKERWDAIYEEQQMTPFTMEEIQEAQAVKKMQEILH